VTVEPSYVGSGSASYMCREVVTSAPFRAYLGPVTEHELACESVYFTLFKLVELAEYENADAAVEWAQKALEFEDLRTGLVEGVEESRSRRFERAAAARSR
jgi:hypothetical protein